MAALPLKTAQPTVDAIYKAIAEQNRRDEDWRRPHLGASLLGDPCSRALWYAFRWVSPPDFINDGRVLRLLRHGKMEEQLVVRDLRAAGMTVEEVDPKTGKQFRYSDLGGHVGGAMDAKVLGVPEAPAKIHVGEFKTSNTKRFAKLVKEGVEKAKSEHYAQMQLYMRWSGLTRALYICVNKDTDEIHVERVRYNAAYTDKLIVKAARILDQLTPPPGVSRDPSYWVCKSCDFAGVCHGQHMPKEVNCRTCAHATPVCSRPADVQGPGWWNCGRWPGYVVPVEFQRQGCPEHRWIPDLVTIGNQTASNSDENWIGYTTPSGQAFRNGGRDRQGYSSAEIAAPGFLELIAQPVTQAIREDPMLAGEIVDPASFELDPGKVVVTTLHQGPQPPHATTVGKDWGWLQAKAKPADIP